MIGFLKMKKIELVLVISILFLITLVDCYWIVKNTSPPGWDDASYLGASELIYQSANDGIVSFLGTSINVLQRRPPLIAYAAFPIYFVFGSSSPKIALVENLVWLLLFYFFFFLLVKDKFDQRVAIMSVLITATMPLFYGLLRHFFVEFGLMVIIIIWIYFLHKTEHLTNKKNLFILGFITGLGILMKVTFPLYISGFLSVELYQLVKRRPTFFELIANGTLFFIPALVAAPWYIKNIPVALWHAKRSLDPLQLQQYYYGNPFSLKVIYLTIVDIINYVSSWYYFGLAIILLMIIILKRKFNSNYYFLISIFPPVFFSIFSPNKDYRLLLPIVPIFGFVISCFLWKLLKEKSLLYFPLILIIPIGIFVYTSVTVPFNIERIEVGPILIIDKTIGIYTSRPDNTYWPTREIVKFINNAAASGSKSIVLTTSEIKEFNINNLSYYAIKDNANLKFNSIAYRGITYSAANDAVKNADFIIELRSPDNYLQGANLDTYEKIATKINWVRVENDFRFPNGYKVIIYKNPNI